MPKASCKYSPGLWQPRMLRPPTAAFYPYPGDGQSRGSMRGRSFDSSSDESTDCGSGAERMEMVVSDSISVIPDSPESSAI